MPAKIHWKRLIDTDGLEQGNRGFWWQVELPRIGVGLLIVGGHGNIIAPWLRYSTSASCSLCRIRDSASAVLAVSCMVTDQRPAGSGFTYQCGKTATD